MINSDLNVGGIHRAFIVTVGGDVRIYIPGLTSLITGTGSVVNEDGTINTELYNENKETLPRPIWCLPNLEAKQHDEVHPCWVTFENGDSKRPIIMGFLGKGIKYHAGGSGGSGTSSGSSSGGVSSSGGKYVGSGTTGNDNGDYIFKTLIAYGASIAGACGVIANIVAESNFSTALNSGDGGKASGICQWHPDRWSNLVNHCKEKNLDPTTIEGQTSFLIHEIQTGYKDLWNLICSANGEDEAYNVGYKMCYDFERPANKQQKSVDRGNSAKNTYWPLFKDGSIENGQYSNNNSKINNYLIDNGAGGTRKEAKEHGPVSGTQCVELPNDYIQEVFGLKNYGGFGNGKDYYIGVSNKYPNVFEKIEWQTGTILKIGDIVSMSSPLDPDSGHVVIIKAVNGNKIQILDQWAGCGNVQDSEWTLDGNVLIQRNGTRRTIYGIARPK